MDSFSRGGAPTKAVAPRGLFAVAMSRLLRCLVSALGDFNPYMTPVYSLRALEAALGVRNSFSGVLSSFELDTFLLTFKFYITTRGVRSSIFVYDWSRSPAVSRS